MKNLRIWKQVRRSKDQWFVYFKKEKLSGPWKSKEEAINSLQEWL